MPHTLRIATRKSPLALRQTSEVTAHLKTLDPTLHIEWVPITTTGDKILDLPLAQVGGKGLFLKELQAAILSGQADLAVHSLKDMPADNAPGLCIAAFLTREDPRDILVSPYGSLQAIPRAATLGTSSLRRQSQLQPLRPDLNIRCIRGNIDTRLAKLDSGEFDGIVLAAAGLSRLGLQARIAEYFSVDVCLPAVGQGIIAVECRADNQPIIERLAALNDKATQTCALAERAMNQCLQGSCSVPIAGFAVLTGETLTLRGLVADPFGQKKVAGTLSGSCFEAENLGRRLGEQLLSGGAAAIIRAITAQHAGIDNGE